MQAWRVLCPAWVEWADLEGPVTQGLDRGLCTVSLKMLGEFPPTPGGCCLSGVLVALAARWPCMAAFDWPKWLSFGGWDLETQCSQCAELGEQIGYSP